MTVAELKLYLRVDGTDEDTFLSSLITAATNYINEQTGKTQVKTGIDEAGAPVYSAITSSEVYNQAVKMLCAHWYENRGVEIAGTLTRITHSVDAIVQHIACCGDFI